MFDQITIRIKFDGVDDPNYAAGMIQSMDTIPDLAAWLADPDSIAAVELEQANGNADWRYGKPKYKTCDITITNDETGESWEGEATAMSDTEKAQG